MSKPSREEIIENTNSPFKRLFFALNRDPLWINTEPPRHPEWADRKDRLHHAWVNLWTESWRTILRRPNGDELSKYLGKATGIGLLVIPPVLLASLYVQGVVQ